MMDEIWKDIPNYEGYYQISSFGNCKSLERKVIKWDGYRTVKERILKTSERNGYLYLNLAKQRINKKYDIHVLVCMAFLDFKPCGHDLVPNHKDSNRLNNHISNFEIVTSRKNISEAFLNKKTSSIYTGVAFDKKRMKWTSRISIKGKYYHLGYFKTELDASMMYELALGKINNSTFELWYHNLVTNPKKTSKFKGVSWVTALGKWRSQKYVKGVQHHLGLFESEIDASKAYENWKLQITNNLKIKTC